MRTRTKAAVASMRSTMFTNTLNNQSHPERPVVNKYPKPVPVILGAFCFFTSPSQIVFAGLFAKLQSFGFILQ